MKKIYLSILVALVVIGGNAQDKSVIVTTTFDPLPLATESYWDGSDLTEGFQGENLIWQFANIYDTAFGGYWSSGWAYSNETDVSTTGNQFSSYVGSDVTGAGNYIIGNAFGSVGTHGYIWAVGQVDFYVSNSTYSAISMRDGDTFAKKFGDSTDALGAVDSTNGDDWFKLTVYGYQFGSIADSVEVYLADYRFSNDSLDYILNTWEHITMFGVDSLNFVLSSSDVGSFGMNTPAFFCLDHITGNYATSIKENEIAELSFYPNPATDQILIKDAAGQLEIYSIDGQLVQATQVFGTGSLDVSALSKGIYQMVLRQAVGISTAKLIKQ